MGPPIALPGLRTAELEPVTLPACPALLPLTPHTPPDPRTLPPCLAPSPSCPLSHDASLSPPSSARSHVAQSSSATCCIEMVNMLLTKRPCGVAQHTASMADTIHVKTPMRAFHPASGTRHMVLHSDRNSGCDTDDENGRRDDTARQKSSAASRTDA